MAQMWEIVGGTDKGGILVREGADLKSTQLADRVSTGALVEELELVGKRLHYKLREGTGPAEGWVSLKLKEKPLVQKSDRTYLSLHILIGFSGREVHVSVPPGLSIEDAIKAARRAAGVPQTQPASLLAGTRTLRGTLQEEGDLNGAELRLVMEQGLDPALVAEAVTRVATNIFAPDEDLEMDMPLRDQGLDSLDDVAFRKALMDEFSIPFPSTFVFDYPNIWCLTDFIVEELKANSSKQQDYIERLKRQQQGPNQNLRTAADLGQVAGGMGGQSPERDFLGMLGNEGGGDAASDDELKAEISRLREQIAKMESEPAAVVSPPVYQPQVDQLTALGFNEDQARQALAASGGDVEAAVDWLLS